MRTRGYIIYAVAAYLVFLVGTFPASKAYRLITKRAGENTKSLELAGIEGPWWSATATQARIGPLEFTNAGWRLQPLLLLIGNVVLQVHASKADEGYIKSRVAFGFGKVSLKKTEMSLPLSILDPLGGPFGVRLDGMISSSINKIILRDGYPVMADGVIILNNMQILSPQQLRLGDFKVVMVTEEKTVRLTFVDSGGPLKAEGVLQLNADGGYDFSGTFLAQDQTQPTLADYISLMGKPDDNGQVTVSMSGKLPRMNI